MNVKLIKLSLAGILIFGFFSCRNSQDTEEVQLPSEGLITIVKEVEKDLFKIDDEITIPDTNNSLIVAIYMDEKRDTFTLQQARLMQANGGGGHHSSGIMHAASYGLMGYMMGRSMSGFSPSAGAYTSPSRFNDVNQRAGNSIRSSAQTVSRPRTGSSGFGSGRSTRSVGG
jgi:hypothetical protein